MAKASLIPMLGASITLYIAITKPHLDLYPGIPLIILVFIILYLSVLSFKYYTSIFEIDDEQGYLVVRFSGEIDLYGTPHAREVILNCVKSDRNTVIDLSAVTYIDSSGVASLVEGYQLAKNNQLEFGLINISEAVMNVLQLAHLDKVFSIHASLSERLQAT